MDDNIKLAELYGCNYGDTKVFLGGLECEIEAVPENKGGKSFGIFQCKEDLSLRNNGWEFVSKPAERAVLEKEFEKLQKYLSIPPELEPFSHRTSTHVHVNVASLTSRQAKTMLMLYALYEPFFFHMVKPERRDNIHCVPLTETHLPMYYAYDIVHLRDKWSKYSALNLLRMSDLGTMEFRHLHGTGDVKELSIWLQVLENIWKLSQDVEISVAALSSEAIIKEWFSYIFAPSENSLMLKPTLMNIIQNSLVDVKFSAIGE